MDSRPHEDETDTLQTDSQGAACGVRPDHAVVRVNYRRAFFTEIWSFSVQKSYSTPSSAKPPVNR